MGQRLNIEIHNEKGILANCYYHWSGFTSTALKIARLIVVEIEKGNLHGKNGVEIAINLLKTTGATLTQSELDYHNEYLNNVEIGKKPERIDRNDGLISISPNGILETRLWEECRIEIDYENKTVRLQKIVCKLDKNDYKEDELKDVTLEYLIPKQWIKFDIFKKISDEIIKLIKNKQYRFIVKNQFDSNFDEYYCFIE